MSEPVRELAALQQAIPPNWRAWAGVTGRLYVRRLLTSPPRTLGGTAAADLARQAGTVERLYRLPVPEGE
jgi:hypothetical protein